jgi:hypothetical protein
MYGYLIAGVTAIGLLLGVYFYGHHEGTLAGNLRVSSLEQQIASNSADFERQARAREAANEVQRQRLKDQYDAQLQTQTRTNAKLSATIISLRTSSNSYVAQIERLSGQDCGPSNAALSLAYKQYGELADFARQTAARADNASAVANTLDSFVK